MGDLGDYWRDVNSHYKQQKANYDARIRPVVYDNFDKLKKLGYEVKDLNGFYHKRINGVLDIFPQNMRYHDLRKNERGDYHNLVKFVQSRMRVINIRE